MGLFRKKTNSGSVAANRLRMTLVYDRAGTSSNRDLIEMMKKDIIAVITKYVDIDEEDLDLNIKTTRNMNDGITSELVANIPIRQVKMIGRNRGR
ncbi:MAG: cell division topological specificity factor MinE [Christensenellaceae bacterium]|nr:cell division topological specificity factor MinE [Christensenellaceae bacterium]